MHVEKSDVIDSSEGFPLHWSREASKIMSARLWFGTELFEWVSKPLVSKEWVYNEG